MQSVFTIAVRIYRTALEFFVLFIASLALVFGIFLREGWSAVASDASEASSIILTDLSELLIPADGSVDLFLPLGHCSFIVVDKHETLRLKPTNVSALVLVVDRVHKSLTRC